MLRSKPRGLPARWSCECMPGQSAAVLSYKALTKENRIQAAFLHLIMFPNLYIYMTVK